MTALTLYQSNDNNVTGALVAKRVYATSNAGSFTSHTTAVNSTTATGFGELLSRGGGSSWAALGAIGAQSGHGLLLDDTSMEGQQILAGTWSTIVRVNSSIGSVVGDIVVRYSIWNSVTLAYTTIGTGTLAAQTLTTTTTNYTVTATGLPFAAFHANDKLYIDVWFKIATNSQGTTTGTINWSGFTTTAGSGSATVNTATPGYQVSPSATFTGHGTLAVSGQAQGTATSAGHGTLSASGQVQGKATGAGHGALVGSGQAQGKAISAGHGILLASGVTAAQAALSGHGTLKASGQGRGTVRFAGYGALAASVPIPIPTASLTATVRDGTVTAVVRSGAVVARVRDGTITVKVR